MRHVPYYTSPNPHQHNHSVWFDWANIRFFFIRKANHIGHYFVSSIYWFKVGSGIEGQSVFGECGNNQSVVPKMADRSPFFKATGERTKSPTVYVTLPHLPPKVGLCNGYYLERSNDKACIWKWKTLYYIIIVNPLLSKQLWVQLKDHHLIQIV